MMHNSDAPWMPPCAAQSARLRPELPHEHHAASCVRTPPSRSQHGPFPAHATGPGLGLQTTQPHPVQPMKHPHRGRIGLPHSFGKQWQGKTTTHSSSTMSVWPMNAARCSAVAPPARVHACTSAPACVHTACGTTSANQVICPQRCLPFCSSKRAASRWPSRAA